MLLDKKADELYVLSKFPKEPKYYEILMTMLKNYFSGVHPYTGLQDCDDKFLNDMLVKVKYYKSIYDAIWFNWIELEKLLYLLELDKKISKPGELFAIYIQNDAKSINENLDKTHCKNLNLAYYEYIKCRLTGKTSKKLDTLINRLEKKVKIQNKNNTLILELVTSVARSEDVDNLTNTGFEYYDCVNRKLRNLTGKI